MRSSLPTIVGELEGLGARWAAELPDRDRRRLAAELTELNELLVASASRVPADAEEVFDLHRAG
ncbi:hypothetical protein BH23GEM8_BH23GEM8_11040 [soil metagenome]